MANQQKVDAVIQSLLEDDDMPKDPEGETPLAADDAMDQIQGLLSGVEWSSDTLDAIAEIVKLTGREINPPEAEDGDLPCGESPAPEDFA